jgi:hypothetical protein
MLTTQDLPRFVCRHFKALLIPSAHSVFDYGNFGEIFVAQIGLVTGILGYTRHSDVASSVDPRLGPQ